MSVDRKNRGKTPKKRRFHGNRYTSRTTKDLCSDLLSADDETRGSCSVLCGIRKTISDDESVSKSATPTLTASEKKILDFYNIPKKSDSEESDDSNSDSDGSSSESETSESEEKDNILDEENIPQGHRIVDIGILSNNISSFTVCRYCHGELILVELSRKGLGSEFAFHCNNTHCTQQKSFHSCEQISVGNLSVSSINRRSVFAMRSIGCDHAELETFCGVMDLPPPVQQRSYSVINKTIEKASSKVQTDSCKKAAEREHQLAEGDGDSCRNIDVSCDGSWMTPGHSSKHFVGGAPSKEYPDPLPASCSSETSQSTSATPKAKQSCPRPSDRSTSCNNQPPKKRLRKTLAYCEALTQSDAHDVSNTRNATPDGQNTKDVNSGIRTQNEKTLIKTLQSYSQHFLEGTPTPEHPDPTSADGCKTPILNKVSSRKLPQDREDAWHRTLEKNRARRRKHTTFNTHNSCSIAEEDHPAIFSQKHLTMPAASVLLHDYDGAIAIDSSKMVELSNGFDATVTQQSQRCSSRRTVTHKNQQRPSRRRRTHSRSKSLSQDSDQTEAGGRSNSQQESPESKQMSALKIEIDIADDPAQLWMRESSSQVSGHCRSAVPHVQVMQTEPDGEYNHHSVQCQEAVTEELASHEYSMDVKQEKDRDLCSCNQELSTEQLHTFELGTEIKQEIDMSSCSHSEDISTKQYLAGELGMEIKHEKNVDVHRDSSQCHESELCMGIKQEKDTDVGFACESFISEQFQACDYKVDTKIKQEKDMGYAEAFSSEQYYSSKFGIEIKQEVDLDELTQ